MPIHKLYGELSVFLVRAVTGGVAEDSLRASRAIKGDVLQDLSQTTFENACAVLMQLSVAYYDSVADSKILAIDESDVRRFVMDRSMSGESSMPDIDAVLSAWICCADFWGFVSPQRIPFEPNSKIRAGMTALIEHGYARPAGPRSVIWTDAIANAMRQAGLWNEDNVSFEEIADREIELEARAALSSIPADVRHAALRGDVVGVTNAFASRWIDGGWIESDETPPWWALAGANSDLARKLIDLVESDARSVR